jgi:hypothetical protein
MQFGMVHLDYVPRKQMKTNYTRNMWWKFGPSILLCPGCLVLLSNKLTRRISFSFSFEYLCPNLGSNLDSFGGNLASNHLSYGTTHVVFWKYKLTSYVSSFLADIKGLLLSNERYILPT